MFFEVKVFSEPLAGSKKKAFVQEFVVEARSRKEAIGKVREEGVVAEKDFVVAEPVEGHVMKIGSRMVDRPSGMEGGK